MSNSWNDRIKSAAETLSSQIPYVGSAVKALIQLFWPDTEPNIWDLIKNQTSELVNQSILAKELEDDTDTLNGLKDSLNQYLAAQNHEKGTILSSILVEANILYRKFTGSSNKVHLISPAIACAHLHLTLLRERYSHGKEIYSEDNTSEWLSELTSQHDAYRDFFRSIYPQWKSWRNGQITATWDSHGFIFCDAEGSVSDAETNETVKYSDDYNSIDDYFKNVCLAAQTRMLNQAAAAMIGTVMSSSFLLNVYLPGQENDKPEVDPNLSEFSLGPYSCSTLGLNKSDPYSTDTADTPGSITQIYVRSGDCVDALQFIYSDHKGNLVGNPNGGSPHTIGLSDNAHFVGFKFCMADGNIRNIEVISSDGSSSGILGGQSNWNKADVNATVDPSYQLIGGSFKQQYNTSRNLGVGVIELQFKHSSLI